MNSYITILGRQPALGLAELESLYGADAVEALDGAALVTGRPDFSRLGGSVKQAVVLQIIPSTDWRAIELQLAKLVPQINEAMPADGKVQLGLSVYGLSVNSQQLLASGLTLKKHFRKLGRSVRLVPNSEPALSSASVFHNHLTGPTGCELIVFADGGRTIIARTSDVQDIDSYTRRDRLRPKRDARVGMLPPKLAQIIINLATGGSNPTSLLDPFCGTGVLLQEAALMGIDIVGSDIDQRMIEFSDANLLWLLDQPENRVTSHSEDQRYFKLAVGDATTHQWQPVPPIVASETYLGKPFTSLPPPGVLAQTVNECNTIIRKFLQNIGRQLQTGNRLCLALPAWQVRSGQFRHLPLLTGLDSLLELGYNRISFEHVPNGDLIYYRPDQTVARELLVIEKI